MPRVKDLDIVHGVLQPYQSMYDDAQLAGQILTL